MAGSTVIAAAVALGLAIGAVNALGVAAPALADDYPSRPITMIVPLAPGGSTDVLGRIVAQAMAVKLGQPIVVENAAGAAGVIGVTRAERAAPDGYTIQWGMWGTNMANGAIYSLDFDLLNDFEPVVLAVTQPFFINSRKTLPANNLRELMVWLKTNAEKTTEGNSGVGSPSHIAGILLQRTLNLKWQMVPYRSAGLSMQDLVAGTTDIELDAPPVAMPQLQGGTIKTYAVTAKNRLAIAPDIPTTDEAGLPGFYFSFWHALWAPKGTPKAMIAKLNAAAVAALADPQTRQRLIDFGQEIYPPEQQTPAALYAFQKGEIAKWWPIIKDAGIKPQ